MDNPHDGQLYIILILSEICMFERRAPLSDVILIEQLEPAFDCVSGPLLYKGVIPDNFAERFINRTVEFILPIEIFEPATFESSLCTKDGNSSNFHLAFIAVHQGVCFSRSSSEDLGPSLFRRRNAFDENRSILRQERPSVRMNPMNVSAIE
jgi:hypothetical protein